MKVILAEKPSVGKSIAACLGVTGKEDGYLEGNGYQVTWAFGHLVGLAEPEAYLPESDGKWRMKDLPILPDRFIYEPKLSDGGARKQFNTIKKLFNEADEIICATDAGREGEAIFRYIYDAIKCKKPVKRLWISSLTDVAIKKGFSELHDGDEFLNLYQSAKARAEADWLIGMNGTRALTIACQGNGVLSIGRVQTPTLGMICSRFLENKNFVPKPYFTVNCELDKGMKFTASMSERFETEESAKAVIAGIGGTLVVSNRVETEIKEKAPLPFDITSLQAEANRRFKFKAQKTLDIVQSLYEQKKVTYPRTGSRYLGTDMVEDITGKIGNLSALKYSTAFTGCVQVININCINRSCFNDAKLTDHHAIIPTFENVSNDAEDFSEDKKSGISKEDERKIYELITKQLVMALLAPCLKDKLTYEFEIGGERKLTASGVSIKEAGWRAIFEEEPQDEDKKEEDEDNQKLPNLQKGDECTVLKKNVLSKMTQKPPLLTEATLLKRMESAGKDIDDSELSKAIKDCGLGTPATRAAVIETLFKREFVMNEKNHLVPTEKGMSMYNLIKAYSVADVSMTGEWEMKLNKMAEGEFDKDGFDEEIRAYTRELTDKLSKVQSGSVVGASKTAVGKCPICGKDVIEGKLSFFCTGYKKDDENSCKFGVRKEIAGKTLSAAIIKKLLEAGKTDVIKGFKSKEGKAFDAMLVLEEGKVNFKFEEYETVIVGKCPICGKDVKEGKLSFFCTAYKKDDEKSCKFGIRKEIAGKTLSAAIIKKLLEAGKTDVIKGFKSKEGKAFDAMLVLEEGKVNFKFEEYETVIVGKCPLCGKDVAEGAKGYFCTGHKKDDAESCGLAIWKEIAGKTLSAAIIKKLLESGKTETIKGFTSKSGKKFDAQLVLKDGKVEFVFADKKK